MYSVLYFSRCANLHIKAQWTVARHTNVYVRNLELYDMDI